MLGRPFLFPQQDSSEVWGAGGRSVEIMASGKADITVIAGADAGEDNSYL